MHEANGYPYQEDMEWIAFDQAGCLARFTTGGRGPIPASVLQHREAHRAVQHLIESNAPECEIESCAHYSDMADFRRCSERGFFTYDWSDVHRVEAEYRGVYEVITRPRRPITVDVVLTLAPNAETVIPRMDVSFEKSRDLPVDRWFAWIRP